MFQVFLDTLCCGSFSSLDAVSTTQSSVSVMDALTAVSMDIFTFISSFCFSTCRRSILSLPPNAPHIKAHGVLHSVDNAASQETSVNLTHCPWFFTPEKRGQRSWRGCWLEEKMEMKTPYIKLYINMDPNSYGISKLIFYPLYLHVFQHLFGFVFSTIPTHYCLHGILLLLD